MSLRYTYQKTEQIGRLLEEIEVLKKVFDILPPIPHREETIRRQSLLKSSVYSARIEGNPLQMHNVSYLSLERGSPDQSKKEIFNILKTLRFLQNQNPSTLITADMVKRLHAIVMDGLTPDAGMLRTEVSAIFNQAGVAIYMTPPPSEIAGKLDELMQFINTSDEKGPIIAALAHFDFEKIHPFLDGNGRVGRTLSTLILKTKGYELRGLVSFEEYLENNRQYYYDCLNTKSADITDFVEFFLQAMAHEAELVLSQLKSLPQVEEIEETLLPRRQEILSIIRDHQLVSFDMLQRRFIKVPSSTLHYDLKQLLKLQLIQKKGSTRGACYVPVER